MAVRRCVRGVAAPGTVLLVCLLVLAGCGGEGNARPEGLPGKAEQLLTASEIRRHPEGSPARTLYEWWRSAQYADLTGYLEHYETRLRRELEAEPNTEGVLEVFAGFIRTARPVIQQVEREGETTTVYTEIEFRRPVGTTHYATTTRPQAFTMVRQRGEWRLVDDLYVDQSVGAVVRASEQPAQERRR